MIGDPPVCQQQQRNQIRIQVDESETSAAESEAQQAQPEVVEQPTTLSASSLSSVPSTTTMAATSAEHVMSSTTVKMTNNNNNGRDSSGSRSRSGITSGDNNYYKSFLKPFGREDIYDGEMGEKNDFSYYFARGSFGELSIGIRRVHDDDVGSTTSQHYNQNQNQQQRQPQRVSLSAIANGLDDDDQKTQNNTNKFRYSFVAIKTIERAIEPKGGGGGYGLSSRFGSYGGQSSGGGSRFGGPSNNNNNSSNIDDSSMQYQLNKDVFNEIMALQILQGHPNIVNLCAMYPTSSKQYGITNTTTAATTSRIIDTSTSLSLVFDYCPADLHEGLQCIRRILILARDRHQKQQQQAEECSWQASSSPLLTLPSIYSLIDDTVRAVEHCHECGIIHGDIKPGNLLITACGKIQLCDFGIAKPYHTRDINDTDDGDDDDDDDTDRALCTLYYRPPEILLGGRSKKPSVDMWSVGCVLGELLLASAGITSPALFPGRNVLDQLSLIYHTIGTPTQETWPNVERDGPDYGKLTFQPRPPKAWDLVLPFASERSPIMLELLSSVVCLDPSKRLTATEALSTISTYWVKNGDKINDAVSTKADARKQVQKEILSTAKLWIPPMLDSTNPVLASKVAKKIAQTRRTISVR